MLFWVIAGMLTLAVGGLLLTAILRVRDTDADEVSYDVQVYRDQLNEVERDLARGVVTQDEAERVRVEVSRRLLEADKAAGDGVVSGQAPVASSSLGAVLIALVLVVGSGGLYARYGAPGFPDLPLKQRLADADAAREARPSQTEMEARINQPFTPAPGTDPQFLELMDRLRAAIAENPDELQGQMLLARNESLLRNFKAAHLAQARVIDLKGPLSEADDYATWADLMILATNGFVSPEAEEALNRALRLDPRNGPSRYYLGQMYAQSGRADLAYRIWRPLLEESRPEAPWVQPILAQIEQVAEMAGVRYTPPQPATALPGPSAEDMQAASDMSPEERTEMIRGMVNGLSERLNSEGGSPEEWARLINALGVLGETDRASEAFAQAKVAHGAHPPALATIRAAAQNAGVVE